MAELHPKTLLVTGVASSGARERTPSRTLVCRVLSGDEAGRDLAIGGRTVQVGSDPTCDAVLVDPTVSRRHAELQSVPEGLRIRDLDSTNGTFSGGSRISEAVVPPGAVIRFGDLELRVSATPAPAVPPSERTRFGGLIGKSPAMREIFTVLELSSASDATVLIEGESGTGKELAARAIHDHSARAAGPFVVVDCGATKAELIESHLFGHEVGAFTGAAKRRAGAFVEADGGTIFLDELGELPLELQVKLLRVLEAGTIQPLGSDASRTVDVRVVAATNRALQSCVDDGTFRFDLYYRVAVVHLAMPALRERVEDLPLLIQGFYEGRGADPGEIAGENLELLSRYAWPGNVRELRNVLERAWVYSGARPVPFSQLRVALGPAEPIVGSSVDVDTDSSFKDAKSRWVEQFERRYLEEVYARFDHKLTRAAEHSGLSRQHFRELLQKYGLHRS